MVYSKNMPYKRYQNKPSSRISKRKTTVRKSTRKPATKNMVALIKKTVMRSAETKEHAHAIIIAPLFHNTPAIVANNLLRTQLSVVASPNYVDPRIGDSIQSVGITIKMLFMTYSDRPNVTFKVWIVKAPPYSPINGVSPYTYDGWFKNRTGQWILDDINHTQIQVIKSMTFKPPVSDTSQEPLASLHETSYARKIYVPWNKTVLFQEQGAANPAVDTKNYSLQLMCAAYDTYGTLLTDLAGKMLIQHTLRFKDF